MRFLKCCCLSILLLFLLTGCGGGGGNSSDNFTVSTSQLNFSADVEGATPTAQVITGTVNDVNTPVRVDVVILGTAIQSADFNFVGTNSGTLTVTPRDPSDKGIGTHTDTITVYVCTDLNGCVNSPAQVSGSPKIINVTYEVTGTPQIRYVAPYRADVNTSNEVIIRGIGFSLLPSPAVSFGSFNALSTNIINDSEIRATHPPLVEGVYQVNVSDVSGPIATNAQLVVVNDAAFDYNFISSPGLKPKIIYDAERKTIFVANLDQNQVERYVHGVDPITGNDVWTATTLPINQPHDVALTPDGGEILVLSGQVIEHVDAQSFTISGVAVSSPISGHSSHYLNQIAVANNGQAILTVGNFLGSMQIHQYDARQRAYKTNPIGNGQGAVAASIDGSQALVTDGENNILTPIVYRYDSTTDDFALSMIARAALAVTMDKTGDTALLGYQNFINDSRRIYKSLNLSGSIPGSSTSNVNFASALSSDGSFAYSYNPQMNEVNIYDLNSPDGVGGFGEIVGSPIAIPDSIGDFLALKMAISLSNRTLFIAGVDGIIIQPLP